MLENGPQQTVNCHKEIRQKRQTVRKSERKMLTKNEDAHLRISMYQKHTCVLKNLIVND